MSNDLVKRLRDTGEGDAYLAPTSTKALIDTAADRIEALEKALHAMLHAVCHETGFAAAVRADSGKAYPWVTLDAAEEQARAALEGKDER